MAGQRTDLEFTGGLDLTPAYKQLADFAKNAPEIKLKLDSGPLGAFSRKASEFQKSLQASQARVLAFSLTASQIYTVTRAFEALLKSTIEVEKQLIDINSILGLSQRQLTSFSRDLFRIANDTGQSFQTVAEGAVELSRQGLSAQETLKRLKDALTLTRLSGLNAADSVTAITTALNGFNDAALDSTIIVNKLANVDAQFAVSSKDLADALQRVGSTAKDTGVSFDELLGLVTAAKQVTGREGAVIGNALKTIFQRIERPEVLENLKELRVVVEQANGESLSAIDILTNLAKTYEHLSSAQQNQVIQLSAGVFQANQFRAILQDLAKENSLVTRATNAASSATNQAARRQDELNKSLSANINTTINNLTELASKVGTLTLEPLIRRITGQVNELTDILGNKNDSAFGDVGASLGEGLMKGLGNYLSGPGFFLGIALLGKLTQSFIAYTTKSLSQIIEVGNGRVQQEQAITNLLAKEPSLYGQIIALGNDQLKIQQLITNELIKQAVQANKLSSIQTVLNSNIQPSRITRPFATERAFIRDEENLRLNPRRNAAVGLIPSVKESIGALEGGYQPGAIKTKVIPQIGQVVYNTAEQVKTFPGFSQPAIIPPQNSKAGRIYKKDFISAHGFNPYANKGLIPNFATIDWDKWQKEKYGIEGVDWISVDMGDGTKAMAKLPPKPSQEKTVSFQKAFGVGNEAANIKGTDIGFERNLSKSPSKFLLPEQKALYDFLHPKIGGFKGGANKGLIPNYFPQISRDQIKKVLMGGGHDFFSLIYDSKSEGKPVKVRNAQWSSVVRNDLKTGTRPGNVERQFSGNFMTIRGVFGDNPDTQIKNISLDKIRQINAGGEQYDILSRGFVPNYAEQIKAAAIKYGKDIFKGGFHGEALVKMGQTLGSDVISQQQDIRITDEDKKKDNFSLLLKNFPQLRYRQTPNVNTTGNIRAYGILNGDFNSLEDLKRMVNSVEKEPFLNSLYKRDILIQDLFSTVNKYNGLIPNFSALTSAINREHAAGIPLSQIRVGQSSTLKSHINPLGLGVYNTKDEPGGLQQGITRVASMGLNPKTAGIPNYAAGPEFEDSLIPKRLKDSVSKDFSDIQNKLKGGVISLTNALDELKKLNNVTKFTSQSFANLEKSLKGIDIEREKNRPGTLKSSYDVANAKTNVTALIPYRNTTKLSPAEAAALSIGAIDINKPESQKLIGGNYPNFILNNPSNKGNRGNILSGFTPAGLLPAQSTARVFNLPQELSPIGLATDPALRQQALANALAQNKARLLRAQGKPISPGQVENFRQDNLANIGLTESERRRLETQDERAAFSAQRKGGSIVNSASRLVSSNYLSGSREGFNREIRNLIKDTSTLPDELRKDILSKIVTASRAANQEFKTKSFIDRSNNIGFTDIFTGKYSALRKEAIRTGQSGIFEQNVKQRLQSKALNASFVLPVLSGLAEEGITSTLGDTRGSRIASKTVGALGNVASFTATGFAIGGPAGAIGGAGLGLFTELPGVIKAVNDSMPELIKNFQSLKETNSRTSTSLNAFIDASEKLGQIDKFGGVTANDRNRIFRNQLSALGNIPDIAGRDEVRKAISSGNINKAREITANISSILEGRQNTAEFRARYANLGKGIFSFGTEGLTEGDKKLIEAYSSSTSALKGAELNQNGTLNPLTGGFFQNTEKQRKEAQDKIAKLREKQQKDLNNFLTKSNISQELRGNITDLLGKEDSKGVKFENILAGADISGKSSSEIAGSLRGAFKGKVDENAIALIDDVASSIEQVGLSFKDESAYVKLLNDTLSTKGISDFIIGLEKIQKGLQEGTKNFYDLTKLVGDFSDKANAARSNETIANIRQIGALETKFSVGLINTQGQNKIQLLNSGGNERLGAILSGQETSQQARGQQQVQLEQINRSLTVNQRKTVDNFFSNLQRNIVDEAGNQIIDSAKREAVSNKLSSIQDLQKIFLTTTDSKSVKEFGRGLEYLQSTPQIQGLEDTIAKLKENAPSSENDNLIRFFESLRKTGITYDKFVGLKTDTKPALRGITELGSNLQQQELDANENRVKVTEELTKTLAESSANVKEGLRFISAQSVRNIGLGNATSRLQIGEISRLGGVERSLIGSDPYAAIRLQGRSEFETSRNSLIQNSLSQFPLNRFDFQNNSIDALVNQQTQKVSELRAGSITREEEQGYLDKLLELQSQVKNREKEINESINQRIETRKIELSLTRDIVAATREQNLGLAKKGDFNTLLSGNQIQKTLIEPLQYNQNDFWNDMTGNLQDFSIDFKQSFKDVFREGIKDGANFGEVVGNVFKNLGYNILGRATDQLTDTLFGSLFGSGKQGQSILGGGQNGYLGSIFSGLFKRNGGPIGKYASGGFVNMGSGVRDDVPALLSGGEFVINAKSTKRLGVPLLNALNGIKRYASGGEAVFNLTNEYTAIGNQKLPTSGKLNVSPYLSVLGQTDTNNPQNALKFAREKYFEDLTKYNEENQKILKNYYKQQQTRRITAYITAGFQAGQGAFSAFGGGPSAAQDAAFKNGQGPVSNTYATSLGYGSPVTNAQIPTISQNSIFGFSSSPYFRYAGGIIPKNYNFGGNVFGGDDIKDTVPAYLMGGEFVFNKSSAKKIGLSNLNYMNKTGRIPGFAAGGYVGSYSPSRGYESDTIQNKFDELIAISAQIRDSFNKSSSTTNPTDQGTGNGGISIINQITVQITDSGTQSTTSTQAKSNDKEQSPQKQEQAKQIGETVNQLITKALIEESRDGGYLSNVFKKK